MQHVKSGNAGILMDELISQLRSTQKRTTVPVEKKILENSREEAKRQQTNKSSVLPVPASQTDCMDEVAHSATPTHNHEEPCHSKAHYFKSSQPVDLHSENDCTSEVEDAGQFLFFPDYALLESCCKGKQHISVADVLALTLFKVPSDLFAIVRAVELFSPGVYKWILRDRTGTIEGSSLCMVAIGSVVCLRGCSLWHINGVHLNIVADNIHSIVPRRRG